MPAPRVRGTPRLTGPLVRLDGVPSPTRPRHSEADRPQCASVATPRSAHQLVTPHDTCLWVVPLRYHPGVAMNLRLTDAESEALRKRAEQEGRSMQEVARAAITQYVSERPQRLRAAIERVRSEDSELLERLSR